MKNLIVQHREWFCVSLKCIDLKISLPIYNIYIYEHAIIGTREENPVISGVSELVPFSF